jgi:tetratricopeptide (TPR) repeat protein
MKFDKTKAMRDAERFLAQGKLRLAIDEYEKVVKHDKKDFVTLNMLGDLYVKNAETREAIRCFTKVADHYSEQGFTQKAIAVYNKISRIQPNSVEIAEKLADLHRQRGSVTEAKSHYITLAEHYQAKGQKIEALAIWKQIATLDPNNTEVYLTIAASYLEENAIDEAAEALINGGLRLLKKGQPDAALQTVEKALDLRQNDPNGLAAYVEIKFAVGNGEEATARLAEYLEEQPHDRDVMNLLIDCHLKTGDTAEAEKVVVKLVEIEPASFPRFIELARVYLNSDDPDAAARILQMSSEHLLMSGQSTDFRGLVNSVLEKRPEQLAALRLLVRCCSWQKDEAAYRDALERLAAAAEAEGAHEDERTALSQLAMVAPHEKRFSKRLSEVNQILGFDDDEPAENPFDDRFLKQQANGNGHDRDFAISGGSVEFELSNGESATVDEAIESIQEIGDEAIDIGTLDGAKIEIVGDDERLLKEIESIRFYVDNGYTDLATKAIGELRGEFGERAEIDELKAYLAEHEGVAAEASASPQEAPADVQTAKAFIIEDLRSELGIDEDEPEPVDGEDYDTHYHMGVAYQEMGLLDEAIKEFQDAVGIVRPDDGTRRFFQCSNLLGHCFMQKTMPSLAEKWYRRALETPGLSVDEKQAIWYELGLAYEAEGDMENAERYYEKVYAENIDFRDVGDRIRNLAVAH